MAKKKCRQYSGIGGQAVLEGVMMKNKDRYAVAVRRPDGQIEVKQEEYKGLAGGSKIKNAPFIRGVFNFIDSMILGMQTLTYSASFYEEEEEEAEPSGVDKFADKVSKGNGEKFLMGCTVAFSIVLAAAIFIALPFFISSLFQSYVRNTSLLTILEGVVRLVIFLLYVILIGSMKDIQRVYQYHGAEHKCISCIERGRELTVKNVRRSSRQHKRCGTSFLLFVMLVSIVLFMFIRVENPALRLGLRILLLPVVAGISYEIIRLAGRSNNIFVRIISAPGLLLQKLTTREPDDSMIEVAMASVEAVFDWKAYLKEEFGYEFEDEADEPAEELTEEQDQMVDAPAVSEADDEAMNKAANEADGDAKGGGEEQ